MELQADNQAYDDSTESLKKDSSEKETPHRHPDDKRKHSRTQRSKESESDRRMSSGSKRTLAQMSQKMHEDSVSTKRSDGKIHRRSSYKIANKPSSSPRISAASSSRASVDVKSLKHHKSTSSQDKSRLSVHGKGRRHVKDNREISPGSKDETHSSTRKKFPESLGEPVYEGPLKSKNTFVDGKYSMDRAWKSTYAVLRGHCLCLHPDKTSQNLVVYEHAISIGSALVDIAYDYTKRSNVFRVTTLNFSEFLFEAPSSEFMLDWIRALQKQGLAYSRDFLKKKILSSSLRVDKSSKPQSKGRQKQQALSLDDGAAGSTKGGSSGGGGGVGCGTPPPTSKHDFLQPSNFLFRFRSRSPEGRKYKSETTSPGNQNNEVKVKSWREKVAERFKRANSHPGTSLQSGPSSNPSTSPHPSSSGGAGETVGCLGVPLNRCISSPNNEHLPLIVETCINVIESQGLNNRGIYRVPGNSAAISTLQSEVEKDPSTLNRDHEKWNDTNAVVSLLKLFFRKLPEPLVTKELYQSFIGANHTEDKRKRLLKIKELVHVLPKHNFETFRSLAIHLNKVAAYEKTNMMDARNLAIVFGPTLLQPAQDKNMVNMVKDMNDQCQIVESIIAHCHWFFGSLDEDVPFSGVDATKNEPVTSMESQLIEKAQKHLEMSSGGAGGGGCGIGGGGSSKKGRFTSLVGQSSLTSASHKLSKREAFEGGTGSKGMTVFSVESVYCEVLEEESTESFANNKGRRGSDVKSHERASRKKFREETNEPRPAPPRSQAYDRVCPTRSDPQSTRGVMGDRGARDPAMRDLRGGDSRSVDWTSDDANSRSDGAADRQQQQQQQQIGRRRTRARDWSERIPSSSLLRPPRMQFGPRSSQKHARKAPRRTSGRSTGRSNDSAPVGGSRSERTDGGEGRSGDESGAGSSLETHGREVEVELASSTNDGSISVFGEDLVGGGGGGGGEVDESHKDEEEAEDEGEEDDDEVFCGRSVLRVPSPLDAHVPSVEKVPSRRIEEKEEVKEEKKVKDAERAKLPPALGSTRSRLFSSLHSLTSPKRHGNRRGGEGSSGPGDVPSELRLRPKLPRRHGPARLVRTWSQGNSLNGDDLGSPSVVRRMRASLSYESSV